MDAPKSKKALFALCARDCAHTLPSVLANIERYAALFADSAFLFVENDSRDATRAVIDRWRAGRPNSRLITLDGLSGNRVRTLCLEAARNRTLDAIRESYSDYDYAILMDCDEVNAMPMEASRLARAICFLEDDPARAGGFANCRGTYFDLWALRHPRLCPGDVWEEVCDYAIAHGVSDAVACRATLDQRKFALPEDAEPLEVMSGFGGMGVYKIANLLANRRSYVGAKAKRIPAHVPGITGDKDEELGWQLCEHVAFHEGFRERGERLFVLPFLANCVVADTNFPPSAWRSLLFRKQTVPPPPPLAGRNAPCPCGSGLRYKHCHGQIG